MNTTRDGRRGRSDDSGPQPDYCTQCGKPRPPGKKFLDHLRHDCVATRDRTSPGTQKSEIVADPTTRRRAEIRQICERRGIRELVHVTRIEVLDSILKEGLLSRETLERERKENGKFFIPVDRYRFDDRFDMVSLSIAFPNAQMFERRVQAESDKWIVLLLKPSLLWELECAFCQNNAASRTISGESLAILQQPQSLAKLFAEEVKTKHDVARRVDCSLPDWYPTDPQAEVLVNRAVPARYIAGVAFRSWAQKRNWLQQHGHDWSGVQLTVQPYLFGARPS